MDIDRMTPADRVSLCRKYFIIGFLCLPFLWLVNTIWFGKFVFLQKGEPKPRNRRNGGGNNSPDGQSAPLRPDQPSTSSGSGGTRQRPAAQHQLQDLEPAQQPQSSPVDPDVEAEKQRSLASIRTYVILSFIGTLIWTIGIVTWVTIFQLKRAEWGEFGDSISFNIPRGIP